MAEVFRIVPASGKAFWVIGALQLLMVGLAGLFAWIAHSSRHARFEVSEEGVRIRGALYGRHIPADALLVDSATPVDLGPNGELQPTLRTNGVGLPGYLAGWFRLRSGEKALLFLTDRHRVVYIPTTLGYSLLLSVDDPEEFLLALRRATGRRVR